MIEIKLAKSLIGRKEKQILTAKSLGLRHINDVVTQPDNAATKGKITVISHLIQVKEAK